MANFSDLISFTRASVGYYFNSAGNLVQAAINEPRFDYTAVAGRAVGLLIEPAATEQNKTTNATIANTSVVGTPTRTDLTLNALGQFPGLGVASSGSLTDVVRLPNTTNAVAVTNGQPRVIEVYYQAGSSGSLRLVVANTTAGTTSIVAGAIGSAAVTATTAGSLTIVSDTVLKDTLTRRLRLKFTPNADGALTFNLGPNSATVGQDIVYLAAFTQLGSIFTTPILTSGSTVTRAADVAKVIKVGTWFNDLYGTVYGTFRFTYEDTDLGNEVSFWRASFGGYQTNGHACVLSTFSTATGRPNYHCVTDTTNNILSGSASAYSPGQDLSITVGISFDSASTKLCYNGGTVYTGVPSGNLTDVSTFDMVLGGTAPITVLALVCKPNLSTAAELQTLTT